MAEKNTEKQRAAEQQLAEIAKTQTKNYLSGWIPMKRV
jgi:hypothetical protein